MAKTSSPVIAQALAQLRASITALETVAARRDDGQRSTEKLKTELTLVQDDRVRLANDLDAALARLGRFEQIRDDLEKRISRAMEALRQALGHEYGVDS
jgi:chromosome segregation ATPase